MAARANPGIKNNTDETPYDAAKSLLVSSYMKKARLVTQNNKGVAVDLPGFDSLRIERKGLAGGGSSILRSKGGRHGSVKIEGVGRLNLFLFLK